MVISLLYITTIYEMLVDLGSHSTQVNYC